MLCVFVLAFFLPLIRAICPPDTIYSSSFNKCYKLFNQPTGFLAAEQTCQGLGGHLVALGNGYEASFVWGVVLGEGPNINSFWIGANYLLTSSWSWTYNVSFSYSNWAPGQPTDPSSTQCGAVRSSDNYWTKEICSSQKPFVCFIDPNAVPTYPPTPACPIAYSAKNLICPGKCSGNYTQSPIDCKCYNFHQEVGHMLFNNSQAFCESKSGSLVKLTSPAQNNWLINWLYDRFQDPAVWYPWNGLICPGLTKDVCYWVDGTPLTCYDNFDILEPTEVWNGHNPYFCLVMHNNSEFGTWVRCGDNWTQSVICMRDFQ